MNSIRARVLALLLAMLAFAAGVMGTVTYHNVLAETEALFDYQLRQMALSLRDQGEIAPDQAGALADRELDFVIQIWSADGQTIYASRPHDELPARALLGFADVSAGKQTWRTFTVLRGQRVIQVAQPRQIRQRLAAGAALRSVAPLVGIAPLIALLTWAAATRVLRPLRSVARAVREREPQSLSPLPTAKLPDELSPLVAALNGLLGQLAQAMDTQRAFVADAAHELRSPLQALKLQIRLLERAEDEATRAEAVRALAEGVERSAWLVEQLLVLARNEPGAPPLPTARVDLAEAARSALAATVPLAVSRGSELALQADEPVPLQGDAGSLAVLVRNLVDNAVRHSPPGARVEVRAVLDAGAPLLVVDDAGPGIPEAERERVFDRFYRRDPGAGEGSGLGLAIVRTIAARHGATVTLGDSPQGGLRASVRFPAAA
ncbi:ATP-binding protein [Rubrivivax gelatinosus]|uniref:histidine kinase n=3 Tax=Rubrivivax gelatinosus TaxID=28068 RepID=I0HM43_RUBGI|nr:ATP-binding protein [Rubrivivax gelatinosus]MBG6080687.1 two-component system OmpR family sensor kinase/two-component system sensor histidine kinase QseC [Rubrivivax gelatinosus]BAL94080.1 sensor protein [Rubrivivax gelatinosus IL144]